MKDACFLCFVEFKNGKSWLESRIKIATGLEEEVDLLGAMQSYHTEAVSMYN